MKSLICSVLVVLVGFLGCSGGRSRPQPGRKARGEAGVWVSRRMTSSDWDWLYQNFYEHYDKYLTYGVALYHCDSERESSYSEEDFVADSLRLCRDSHMNSYHNDSISCGFIGDPELVFVDGKSKIISEDRNISIEYVVVVLRDRNPAKDIQVGGVFAASDVFRRDVDVKKLVRDVGLRRGVLNKDDPISPEEERNGYSPNEKARYQIIERHMEERGIRYISPPKKVRKPGDMWR